MGILMAFAVICILGFLVLTIIAMADGLGFFGFLIIPIIIAVIVVQFSSKE